MYTYIHIYQDDKLLINSYVFYTYLTEMPSIPSKPGPTTFKFYFWKKPTEDKGSFQLKLFYFGNDPSPNLIAKWILTTQHWATRYKRKTLTITRQMNFIMQNLITKLKI